MTSRSISITSRPGIRPAAALRRSDEGSAMVEFTLVAPLLVSLMFGALEFGRLLQHHEVVNKAVRDAARFLSRVDANCAGSTANWTADVTRAQNLAMTGNPAGGTPVLSYWTSPATVAVTIATCVDNAAGTYRGPAQIPIIQVAASVAYQDLGFLGLLGVGPITLTAAHQQMSIGE